MRIVDLIVAKRNGVAHSRSEIEYIVSGATDGSIPDFQLSAWLMAVCLNGMTMEETTYYTDALCRSGTVIDLSGVGPFVCDKHSTGGVGDKTSLDFVPMVAAAGLPVAMLSGRALGHTGGTLDKLEAIPGFDSDLSPDVFVNQVKSIGMAIGSQTKSLAPADGRLYALRDVTATVQSLPLITASVMSKKLAAGASLIVLDVKCGQGALMESFEEAEALATSLTEVGKRLNKPVCAVITDMDQPLGNAVGHTLEVIEAIEMLKGNGPEDYNELCMVLGSLALVGSGKAASDAEARRLLKETIDSGLALEYFRRLIKAQKGDVRVIEDYSLMPTAKYRYDFVAPGVGTKYISQLNGRKVASACKMLGAAREQKGDEIDLAVGVVLKAKIGSKVEGGQTIAEIHANSEKAYELAKEELEQAYSFIETPVRVKELVRGSVR